MAGPGMAARPPSAGGHAAGLPAGVARGIRVGRRRPRDPPRAAAAARPLADMVRARRDPAVLPRALQRLLAGAAPVGIFGAGLSPGQPRAPRDRRMAPLPGASTPLRAGSAPGRLRLRAPSGLRGIRRLDLGAEEHPLGG